MRWLGYGLSRELWLVRLGIFLNTLGYGAVLPFEVIYLHDVRGFDLGLAGLVVGAVTGAAVVVAPLAGSLIDRSGARAAAVAGGVALAARYAGLAFAESPAAAFAAAAVAGAGNGVLNPAQSTLIATLAPTELRHRATAVSRVAANAGMGIGGAVAGFVAAAGPAGYAALFLANALTYLAYVAVLAGVVRRETRAAPVPGGYREVLRDRALVHLALTNVAMIAVGWGIFSWLLPAYAKEAVGVGPEPIGALLLANTLAVVVGQVPVARYAKGRRRAALIAVGELLFAVASPSRSRPGVPVRRRATPCWSGRWRWSAWASASTRRR